MSTFTTLLRARLHGALAVAATLVATGMLRVAPAIDAATPGPYLATANEQLANWLLLSVMIVLITCACESALRPGWRRDAVQVAALAVATPLYAAFVGASPLLTVQVRTLGLGDARGVFWYVVWIGWAVSALLSWYYRALELAARAGSGLRAAELERQQAQRRLLESRLKALEAQVEPHFLLDTLSRVQALYECDPPGAVHMLDDLIDYLRAALPQLRDRSSTLGREYALVRAYLRIVSARPPRNPPLDASLESAYAPPMVLLPLVQLALAAGPPGSAQGLQLVAGSEGGSDRLFFRADFEARDGWEPAPEIAAIRATLDILFGNAGEFSICRTGGLASMTVCWPAALQCEPALIPIHIQEEEWTSPRKPGAS